MLLFLGRRAAVAEISAEGVEMVPVRDLIGMLRGADKAPMLAAEDAVRLILFSTFQTFRARL